MKTIIREMVETIKQLFAQKQQIRSGSCQLRGIRNRGTKDTEEERKSLRRQVKKRVNLINGVNSLTLQLKEY